MTDLVYELDECAKRQLAFAPDYISKSLEYLAAREIERKQAAIDELVGALDKCLRRAIPHPYDTDADRVRNLYHIEATARAAINKHTQRKEPA